MAHFLPRRLGIELTWIVGRSRTMLVYESGHAASRFQLTLIL